MRKVLLAATSLLAVVAASLVAGAPPAGAGSPPSSIHTVQTFDDLVADDGLLSLREAVALANGDATPSIVVLPPGEYLLDTCAVPGSEDEDGNVNGDLDHTAVEDLTVIRTQGDGGVAAIHQTCDEERIIDSTGSITGELLVLSGGHPEGSGGAVASEGGVSLFDSIVQDNSTGSSGGGLYAATFVNLGRSLVRWNGANGDGGGIRAGASVQLSGSEVSDNHADQNGGGIRALGDGDDDVRLQQSTVARNRASDGGGIFHDDPGSSVVADDSTLAENEASSVVGTGGLVTTGELVARQITVSDNKAASDGGVNNVEAATLSSNESVYSEASEHTAAPGCAIGTATSEGWNWEEGGSTCELAAGTDDVQGGADPGLLPMFDNGGATRTAYLLEDSPLLDRAPFPAASQCGGTGNDQRGVNRPRGEGCETGAIEVPECGVIFGDVGATHPFCWEVGWMSAAGVTTGFPGTPPTFQPGSPVTRQSMSAFLYRLSGSQPFDPPATPTFADVSPTHPFFAEVEWMADRGISTGFPGLPNPTYRPSVAVSRQSMSAFMFRMVYGPTADPEPPATPTFADVGTGHPFYGEVEWMAEAGITTGFPSSPPTYRPSDAVTRQSMSAFMFRLAPVLSTVS